MKTFALALSTAILSSLVSAVNVEIYRLDWPATTVCQAPHQPAQFITSEIRQAVLDGAEVWARGQTYGAYPRNYGNSDGLKFQYNECKQERFEYPLFDANPTWAVDHNRQPGAYRVLFSRPYEQGGKWYTSYCGTMVHPVNDLSRFVKCAHQGGNNPPPLGRREIEIDLNATVSDAMESKRDIGRLARHIQ